MTLNEDRSAIAQKWRDRKQTVVHELAEWPRHLTPTFSLGVTPRLEAGIGEFKYPTECMLPWSARTPDPAVVGDSFSQPGRIALSDDFEYVLSVAALLHENNPTLT
jgi:hypothetical protein